jgi:alcohol oxidase
VSASILCFRAKLVLTENQRYSTALLIGEKAAMLVAEDLGYSGEALEMKIPTYQVPGEFTLPYRL